MASSTASRAGSNGRAIATEKPRSNSVSTSIRPSTTPAIQAATRRAQRGQEDGHDERDEDLERDAEAGLRHEARDVPGGEERDEHQQRGQRRHHGGEPATDADGVGVGAAPEPDDVAAERPQQREEGDRDEDLRGHEGQQLRGRDDQHDALRRRHDLAGELRLELPAQPREHDACGDEQVAREPDEQHPRPELARDVPRQHEQQERVELHVEARAELRGHVAAPRDLAVDPVEQQRHAREHHERGRRHRVGDERGDAHDEHPAGQRHPSRRPQGRHAGADEHREERRGRRRPDDEAERAEPEPLGEHPEQARARQRAAEELDGQDRGRAVLALHACQHGGPVIVAG